MPDFDKDLNPIINKEARPELEVNVRALPSVAYNASVDRLSNYSNSENVFDKLSQASRSSNFDQKGVFVTNSELEANKRYRVYNPTVANQEDYAAYGQSVSDKAANGLLKGVNLAATTVAGGFGMLYGAAKSPFTGRLADIWDNDVMRGLDDWNTKVDQEYLPNYYTDVEKNASWYSTDNWFKANFLFDKLIKNSGFAVGAMVSGNIANAGLLRAGAALGRAAMAGATAAEASQAFKLFSPLLRNTARAFSVGKNIEAAGVLEKEISSIADLSARTSKLGELAKTTNQFAGFNDAARRTAIAAYSSAGEASFEAMQTSKEFRDKLIQEHVDRTGQQPIGEDLKKINEQSDAVGKTSFLGNLAVLSVTEYMQLPKLLGSTYSSSKQAANSLLGQAGDIALEDGVYSALKATTKFGKISSKIAGISKYVFDPKEAAQEGLQYALQVGTQNYYNKAFHSKNADGYVDGFLYGLFGKDEYGKGVGALNSKEGAESIALGGVTGGLMQIKGTYLENKAINKNTEAFVNQLNSTPAFKQAFVDRLNSANRASVLQQQQQDAIIQGDKLEAKDLDADMMHNYLATRIKYGRFDMVMNDISDLKANGVTEEGLSELKQQGLANVNDTVQSYQERLTNFEKVANYTNELYKSIDLRYSGITNEDNTRKYSSQVIDKMVYAASKIANYDLRIPQVSGPLSEAGVTTMDVLDGIIKNNKPSKEATAEALDSINNLDVTSEVKDGLKTALSDVIELSLRRKKFMEEYDDIKDSPAKYEVVDYGELGALEEPGSVSIKQEVPVSEEEGARKKTINKDIEVGKEYSLAQPVRRQGNTLQFAPKIGVLSKTLGGEFEVKLPNGDITFFTPEQFKDYQVSDVNVASPKIADILDKAIDSVLGKKKYEGIEKPTENKLDFINGLNNKELVDEIEKEFNDKAEEYLKELANEIARTERLMNNAEQIKKTQEDIEKLSGDIGTNDDDSDLNLSENFWEDMKKAAIRLFKSTINTSEDWEKGPLAPHVTRFIEFTNKAKDFANRSKLKVILVTSASQKALGLDGLAQMSFEAGGDKSLLVDKEQFDALDEAKKKDVVTNGFIGAVVVEMDRNGNMFFVNKNGERIKSAEGNDIKVTEQAPINDVVFSTMPAVNLYYSNDEKSPRYRNGEKEEAARYAAAWEIYRQRLFEGNPKSATIFDFGISKGVPSINKEAREKNFIGNTLIDNDKLATQNVIVVSTKGSIAHEDGNNYRFANGRPVFKNADDLAYLNNNKFSREKAKAIFAVIKKWSDDINRQILDGEAIVVNENYSKFLQNVLYWNSKDNAAPSANKIYLDTDTGLLHIGSKIEGEIKDNTYDFANIGKYETEVINDLSNAYHNVNDKTLNLGLAEPFVEFYLDENGELKERTWANYQSYLLSNVNPDGSNRLIDEAPLFTNISKPTENVPYPFKQKYLYLQGMDLPVQEVKTKDNEKKDAPIDGTPSTKIGEYESNGVVNKYNIAKIGKDVEFTFTLDDAGEPDVTLISSETNTDALKAAAADKALVAAIKNNLKSLGVFEEGKTDEYHVGIGIPTLINVKLRQIANEEKPEPSTPSNTTPPPPPKVGKPITISEGKITIKPAATETFSERFEFIVKDGKVVDGNYFSFFQGEYSDKRKEEKISNPAQKYNDLSSVYSDDRITVEGTPLKEAPASDIEVKPADQTQKPGTQNPIDFNDGSINNDDDIVYRRVGIDVETEPMSEAEAEFFKSFVAKKVPGLPYEFMDNLIKTYDNEDAYGSFEKGMMKIYKKAAKGTAFHELMEGVWLGFLSPQRRQEILNEFKSKKGSFIDRASGMRIDYNEATDQQAKERIMDDFAEFMDGKIPAKSVSGKILQWFKAILDYIKALVNKGSLKDQLFREVYRGKFKKAIFPQEMMGAAAQYREVEGLTQQQVGDFVQDMTGRIFQKVFSTKRSLFNPEQITSREIFDDIKADYLKAGYFRKISDRMFNELVDRTKDYLRTFNIEFDSDGNVGINDEGSNNRDYAAETFSVNFKKSSPYAVKLLISSLIRTGKVNQEKVFTPDDRIPADRTGSSVNGYMLVPFGQSFNILMNKLNNTLDKDDFVRKLYNLAKENSDYIALFKRLGGDFATGKINFNKYEDNDWRLFTSFYQVFTKQLPDGITQFLDNGQVYSGSANQSRAIDQIGKEWTEGMKELADKKGSIVQYDNRVYKVNKDSDEYKAIKIDTPSGMVDFLEKIGIIFPISTYNRLRGKQLTDFAEAVSGIKIGLDKSNVLISLKTKNKEFDITGNINTLADLYVKSENPTVETSFFNNSGKQQQAFTDSNAPSVFESTFNSVETLDELKKKMPQLKDVFSTTSQILKLGGIFFDEKGNRTDAELKVQYILGDKDKVDNEGTTIAELTPGKRLTLQINQNIKGSYYILIPGDGSTEWMMNVGNQVEYKDFVSGASAEKVHNIFQGYLKDEIALAKDAINRQKLNNVGKKASELRFFKELLSDDVLKEANKIIADKKVTSADIDKFIADNAEAINASIDSFINATTNTSIASLKYNREIVLNKNGSYSYKGLDSNFARTAGINPNNMSEAQIKNLLTFINTNFSINNIEYHKILFGDPYQFKITDKNGKVILDETKRIKSFLSPRRITLSFDEMNDWYDKDYNKAGVIGLTKKDYGYHQFKNYAKTFTAKDVEIVGSLASRFPAYAKTNEADAASWISPTGYREVKLKNAQWSEVAERFHQWQMAYTRQNIPGYVYTNEALRKQDEKVVSYPSPKYVIEVIKPIVTGNKFEKNDINLVLDKFSQMPIYYQAVQGTNLESLYMKMFEGGYDYVVVESGRKVGIEGLQELYKPNGEFNDAAINNTINVPWAAYGIQMENSYNKEKLQTLGSQLTKLGTMDLYTDGQPIGDNPERKEFIKNAVERNIDALSEMAKNGYNELLNKLGIEDLGDGFNINDKTVVANTLRKEMLKREISDNGIDSITINPTTGEFEIPFEASTNYRQIKDILYSIVDKSIASPKVNGFSGVQVAATMWEKSGKGRQIVQKIYFQKSGETLKEVTKEKYNELPSTQKSTDWKKITSKEYEALPKDVQADVQLTSDALKFYEDEDGKRYCEVMLPNWFRKKLPAGKFKTDEELIKYLNTAEGGKILMGIGFRIPTQALNSVEVFKVKGFLPDFMGRTVVVPSEITTKSGSDFDIDKLNMYLKNVYITSSGDIKLVPFFGFGDQAIEKMKEFLSKENIKSIDNIYEDVTGDREDDYGTLAQKYYKQSLENEYYQSLEDLLTLPENFERLVVPNTSKDLEDLASELATLRGETEENVKNRLLDMNFMNDLRHTFITAKRWVGRAAVNITNHSLFQKELITVNDSYFNIVLPHNSVIKDGTRFVSLSGTLDKAGKYISDKLSMYANSFVDVVKDPYIMKIIYSDRLVSTFMFLERAGVPMKSVGLFINQPIIREYVNSLDSNDISSFTINNPATVKDIEKMFPTSKEAISKATIDASNTGLSDNISKFYKNGKKLTDAENAQQRLILEQFFSYYKMADNLFKVTQATNYDTTSFKNADDLFRKQLTTEITNDINPIASPSKILKSSHLGTLAKALDRADLALGEILKFNRPEFRSILERAIMQYAANAYVSKDKFARIAEKLSASFLDYIIQTKMSTIDLNSLVIDSNSVANRIEAAKVLYPEVKILKDFVMESSGLPGGAKTVKLRANVKEAYDENLYIGYMREMKSHPALRDLYKDLVRLAIVQGTYQSAVSIKNIVPLEDYAAIVAPIMKTLNVNDDLRQFYKDAMFQRSNWKDKNIVPRVKPSFYLDIDDDFDPYITTDENDVDIYQYSTKAFPEIPDLKITSGQRKVMKLHPRSKGSRNSVVTVPRIVTVGNSDDMIDFITGQTVTKSEFAIRKKAGDATLSELYGYKRLEDNDGEPIMTNDGYYIYKQINLLGDGQYASEYKLFPTKSPINNGTVKIEQEIPDADILRYMFKDVSPIIPATIQTYIPNEPVTNRVIVPKATTEKKEEVIDTELVNKFINDELINIPVVETIFELTDDSLDEEDLNGWLSEFTEYKKNIKDADKLIAEGNNKKALDLIKTIPKPNEFDEQGNVTDEDYDSETLMAKIIWLYHESTFAKSPARAVARAIDDIVNDLTDAINQLDEFKKEKLPSSTQAPKAVSEITSPVPGVENITNSGLTIEQSNKFIDILQPQIIKQAYIENKARTANMMFSFGLRWAKNIPNESEKSEQAKNLGKPRPDRKQIKSKEGMTYGYYLTDQNNKPLPSMDKLQPIMDFIQSKLGIDMSNYDAMLGNIYDNNSFIHQHRDTTESITAEKYPVIVINLGADGHLEFDKDVKSTYASYKKSGQLDLTNGGIYAFGVNGESRFTFHHRIGSGLESANPLKPITLSNGQTLTNYRITLTFRRASDLEPGMLEAPNRISQPTAVSGEPRIGEITKNNDGSFNVMLFEGTSPDWKDNVLEVKILPNGKFLFVGMGMRELLKKDLEERFSKSIISKISNLVNQPEVESTEPVVEQEEVVDNEPVVKQGKSIFESRATPLEYTSKQTKALADIQDLIDANKQGYYLLAGYAGTGKTTIAENIAVYAQSHGRPVFVLAPTNKATKVLGDKFKNAGVTPEISTIHRAIYGEPDPETGDWIPKANLKNAVIVVDESSMIEKSVMADLIENTKKNNVIVFMGDSFQLEPVGDDSGLFKGEIEQVKDNKSELTEVRRQSFDSNVLKLATLMRIDNKAYVPTVSVEDVKVSKSRDEFISDFRKSVKNNEDSVMIVATNPERMAMNTVARIEKFGSSRKVLNDGEVLAAVANSVDVSNSEIFKIASVRDEGTKHELTFKFGNKTQTFDMYLSYVVLENGKEVKVMHFPQLDRPSLYHGQILQAMRESNRELFENLDNGSDIIYTKKGSKLSPAIVISTYGYAVTAHKSQGSQWSKVFVNQNYSAPTWNPARWFYTAVTRSSKDVIILPTSVNQRINPMDMNARIDQIAKESVPLDLVTLKDGSTYNRADITANMLEKIGYTPEEIGEILKSIC